VSTFAKEQRSLARDLSQELMIARSNGSSLIDARGKRSIDLVMGGCSKETAAAPETAGRDRSQQPWQPIAITLERVCVEIAGVQALLRFWLLASRLLNTLAASLGRRSGGLTESFEKLPHTLDGRR